MSAYSDLVAATPGLRHFWKLDDSGSTAVDAKGTASGTYQGTTTARVNGRVEGDLARSFDGVTGFVRIPNASISGNWWLSAYSVEAIVLPVSAPRGPSIFTNQFTGANAGASNLPVTMGFGHNEGASGSSRFKGGGHINQIGWEVAAEGSNVPLDWQRILLTYDGTTWRLYRNGAFIASLARVNTLGASTLDWFIGRRHDATSDVPYFPGRIQHVAFYDRALTAQEDTDHQNALGPVAQYQPRLVANADTLASRAALSVPMPPRRVPPKKGQLWPRKNVQRGY